MITHHTTRTLHTGFAAGLSLYGVGTWASYGRSEPSSRVNVPSMRFVDGVEAKPCAVPRKRTGRSFMWDVCEMFITDALRTGVGCVMSNQVSVLHAVVWCVAGCRGES